MFPLKDIMVKNVKTVRRDTDIYEAIQVMLDNDITGLPVVNEDGTLAGVISEKDVLNLMYNLRDRQSKVEDFMTQQVTTFNESDSLIDVTECLINNSFRRVPVLVDGRVVGIISRKDVIRFILTFRKKNISAGAQAS
jgi:CBS domain-containing protein